ncbi:MAG: glucoamylase family protein [Polyangia bacterium]
MLAAEHLACEGGDARPIDLLAKLAANRRQLFETYRSASAAAIEGRWMSAASDWLLDNFHVVQEQLREAREDLPRHFARALPRFSSGPSAGLPRAFVIASDLVVFADGKLDIARLELFLTAYQEVCPLRIGELWAIPIALRHALLDRLALIAARVEWARREREAAADLALELTNTASLGADEVARVLARRVDHRVLPSTTMFVTELLLRLRDQDPVLAHAAEWLEMRIEEQGTTVDESTRIEHQSQAANQLSVGNAITSMRTITATDWRNVVEGLSLVERVLRQDPSGHYPRMDFATRDRYRHVVERVARRSTSSEREAAQLAIELAREAHAAAPTDVRAAHVGTYLLDRAHTLRDRTGYRPLVSERIHDALVTHATLSYLGPLLTLTVLGCVGAVAWARRSGAPLWLAIAIALVAAVPSSELTVAIVNLALTLLLSPRRLPKLDFSKVGIPVELRTLVVVPTMLTSIAGADTLLEELEVRFLANRDEHVHFALLTDFADAAQATMPEDAALVARASRGIEMLNQRHGVTRFLLLHRHRIWNPAESIFMGWERKRGKLVELNRLVLGGKTTSINTIVGAGAVIEQIRYVLTLDSDTRLPRDVARKLVGTLAHPLNAPVVDGATGVVVEGHAILQPRVSVAFESRAASSFSQLSSDEAGIDPYTTAVSDTYQDLFGEGSFVGKGIYDVRAFEQCLAHRVPEETLLSHDLFEGLYARSALVSDVELFDDTPSTYLVASVRRQRWIRGDWQLLPWLGRSTPLDDHTSERNPLSAISRWKLLDNLRRSVLELSTMALFATACAVGAGEAWAAIGLLFVVAPLVLHWTSAALRIPARVHLGLYVRHIVGNSARMVTRCLVALVFLPHQAWISMDAIVRSLWRQRVSHRGLLEWTSAAQAESGAASSIGDAYRTMAPALVGVVLLGSWAALRGAWTTAPLFSAWLLSPVLATWLGRPRPSKEQVLPERERALLRRIARRTWRYFERYVTAADHHLPPDNLQEEPFVLARRTSPTNIGLSLLADLVAVDLGYIGRVASIRRLEAALTTMEQLERYRGHFLNWYDTQTAQPLHPRYVSTVDSGNLCAMLLAVKQGCLQAMHEKASPAAIRRGLDDTVAVLLEGAPWLAERMTGTRALLAEVPVDEAAHLRALLDELEPIRATTPQNEWLGALCEQVRSHLDDHAVEGAGAVTRSARLEHLATRADALATAMEFGFLYDLDREVFSIGCEVQAARLDASFYDLLASESRLGSFVAIAKGDVPLRHWFRLGRPFVQVGYERALVSWTGTMFEYLMPQLLMRTYAETLLDRSNHAVVTRQIEYGRERRVPWGISESAYNARDLNLNYQYGPFGVPGLGIKRGLGDDLVVAPYATALALLVDPRSAVANLERLAAMGMSGELGLYESVDYTPARVPVGQQSETVRAFMAHHQGMTLVAIAEHLEGRRMVERFHSEPIVKATELLLQERVPTVVEVEEPAETELPRREPRAATHKAWRAFDPDDAPRVGLLSNGTYSVMVSAAGGGYSRWGDIAVTRWREDPTLDNWGQFVYVRELGAPVAYSTAYQPTLVSTEATEVCFSADRAEFRRMQDRLEIHTAIVVSSEDDAEIRTVTLTNHSGRAREVELTSYAEIILATPAADAAHPAFGNLFVQLEHVQGRDALLATRRRRSPDDREVWAVHACATEGKTTAPVEWEGDRGRFVGRGRSPRAPAALKEKLSGTVGSVLDPIFSLRRRVLVPARQTVRVRWVTAAASTREAALALSDKYATVGAADRASALAWTNAQAQLHYLDIDSDGAGVYLEIAARVLYSSRHLRARADVIARNGKGQPGLWAYGISGDRPIMLLRVTGDSHNELVRDGLRAHEYFRLRGLSVDLVVLNDHPPSYSQWSNDQLLAIVRSSPGANLIDKPGGIFVRRTDVMPPEDQTLLLAAARVVFVGERGSIAGQLARELPDSALPPAIVRKKFLALAPRPTPRAPLLFDNGIGGFTKDGREYVMRIGGGRATPAPWSNVMANERFGTLVTERGSGYDWAGNSHENRLTAWSNDPVIDPPTSIVWVRDEDSGAAWPTTSLAEDSPATIVRHGQGWSSFAGDAQGIAHTQTVFVAADDPVRVTLVTLENRSSTTRHLTVTSYVEWTLGVLRENSAPHVVTSLDERDGFFVARNTYPGDLGARVAFADSTPRFRSVTGDRAEIFGRNGDLTRPAALDRATLSGRVGAGYDPCAALQVTVELSPGETRDVVFVMGQAEQLGEVRGLVQRYRESGAALRALEAVKARWDGLLGAIQIATPDGATDLLVNRWLLYQVASARLWGRTGFYQSGGAYGFRDQLQDVAALLYSDPTLAREQILRAAAKQFPEGDVLHWWHPPLGRGVRTRISDDYMWLPFVVEQYVAVTGDAAVLDATAGFVEGPLLGEHEHEAYILPVVSEQQASVYEHCARAADHGLRVGSHGLPLMGGGDWNDGMNRVGIGGKGESVWLAWFLIATLPKLVPWAEQRGELERATRWREHVEALRIAVEREAWDGAWYRRAFFDDGTPLGSAQGMDCRIDSLAQTWSVLSGAGDPARARQAMASVDSELVDEDARIVKLLAPPFDHAPIDPGYIRGYVPGVRENGGQYTHAAAWVLQAHLQLGHGDRAGELLSMINPVRHADTSAGAALYRVEPYVLSGDVAAAAPHVGRGGWSWYTGSASWLYRVVVETMLGFTKRGDTLRIDPCIPTSWPKFELTYRHGASTYRVEVRNPRGVSRGVTSMLLDGTRVDAVTLVDDGATHTLVVELG